MNYEYSTLSAIINHPNTLASVDLRSEDFTDPTCQAVYAAIQEVSKTEPVDIVTIVNFLREKTGQDWTRAVGTLANQPYSLTHVDKYVLGVKEKAQEAFLRRICAEIAHSEEKPDITALTKSLMDLQRTDRKWLTSGQDCLMSAFDDIQRANESGGAIGLRTGFKSLDDQLGGWHQSDLVVIGARPAMGKTALLLSMARMCSGRSLIVSCEMARNQVGARLISQASGVGARNLRTGELSDMDWQGLTNATVLLKDKPFWVYDKPGATIYEIAQQARAAKHDHDIEIMFVDYIQIIRATAEGRVNEIEEVAMGLKNIARELDIPVVALAQVNRQCEERADKRPMMADLKGSGAIEQEADVVAFLYRDWVYTEEKENEAELILEKNRHGPIGTIFLEWTPKTMTFSDNGGWL
jgi:replicative DNA helicase